jgi:ribosomal protein L12E/L44/L45/RPP1/RPP2
MKQPTITRRDIAALRYEAGVAGDDAQVELCVRALDGDQEAWDDCVAAIREAHASAEKREA